ncbi:MAG: hypothetical protein E7640_01240 [Ruminococcaceae bacterium]|nr:hypothetical protein [Oscillospiraceae bacterium]
MFKHENNQKIGTYLSELIEKKYPSKRQFCKAYINAVGGVMNDEEIRKMANRISQITKGAKAIQTYDLPIFTDLLGVSCEQILSAGEYSVPQAKRVTNYAIAFSKDPAEWEAFINREDKLILNQDEYCKTILDYALEFRNYELLKYLMDKEYIWFDSRKDNDYVINFGAGTSIERRHRSFTDYGLQAKLNEEDELRLNLIALAADHNDLKMMESLRARETTGMYYFIHYLNFHGTDFYESYNERMVRHISKSSNEVLDYFTDEFEIRDRVRYKDGRDSKHTFIYPFITELLDLIIEEKSQFTETAIKKLIKHNKTTYDKLCKLIKNLKNDDWYSSEYGQSLWIRHCQDDLKFSDVDNIVSFCGCYTSAEFKSVPYGLITNIAHTTKNSKDPIIKHLIEELNESYNKIKNLKDHLEEL